MDNQQKFDIEKARNWEQRVYFVQNQSKEIVADGLKDEKQCRDYIRYHGDYDTPYLIGYTVLSRTPIIKAMKTVLR